MSSDLTFLPWLRGGAGAAVNAAGTVMGANRLTFQVDLTVTKTLDDPHKTASPLTASVSMELLGPGDVIGLAPGQVIRTEPADGATGVEPAVFPAVEFGDPTLPWLFTPAPENAGWAGQAAPPAGSHRLIPWICLVTVPDTDGITLDTAAGTLTIATPADARQQLPDLAEAAAWAHVQYAGDLDADTLNTPRPQNGDLHAADADAARTLARAAAGGTLSRLLSPRQLAPDHRYFACVVPTFMAGRVAGLGGSPKPTAPAGPAWDVSPAGEAALTLPVYYSFTFTTGTGGDFQSLAQLLVHPPQVSGAPGSGLGPRTLTVTLPFRQPTSGSKLPTTIVALPMPGMLEPVGATQPADPAEFSQVQQALQDEVKPRPKDQLPELLPTAYGAVQAGVRPADLAANFAQQPAWFIRLNTDPRLRVAAALGRRVVAAHREELVAAAWAQVEQTPEGNALLSRAQHARAVTQRQLARHLAGADTLSFLQLTSPHASRAQLTAQVATGSVATGSIWSVIRGAVRDIAGTDVRLPAVTSAAYRRIARPRGPHARNTAAPRPPLAPSQLGAAAAPRFDPAQTVPHRVFAERLSAAAYTAAQSDSRQDPAGDPMRGFAHQVSFPAGMITPLAQVAQEAILPGASIIPANTALLLQPNAEQIAAYLIGLNTAASQLLSWRGVPADPRATPFAYFWDQRGQAGGSPDIAPIAGWQHDATLASQLANQPAGGTGVILAVRAELLRRYPTTAVYAAPAKAVTGSTGHTVDLGNAIQPAFTATLPPDLRLFGFPALKVTDAITGDGYFFVFQQQVTETRFGSDAMTAKGIAAPAGNHWTVASLAALATPPPAQADVIADAVRMPPVLAAIHARALQLPGGA